MVESSTPEADDDDGRWPPAVAYPLLSHGRAPEQAPRSGQPWTDAEYEQILSAARAGTSDIEALATQLGRTFAATLLRARRLLPLAERTAPVDRVLRLLREHQQDPSYDWQQVTLEQPPPRPVLQPPALTGIPGLETPDLVTIAYAVGLAASVVDDDVAARVGEELQRRGRLGQLVELRAERLLRQPGDETTWARAASEAEAWVHRVFPSAEYARRDWSYVEPEDRLGPSYW